MLCHRNGNIRRFQFMAMGLIATVSAVLSSATPAGAATTLAAAARSGPQSSLRVPASAGASPDSLPPNGGAESGPYRQTTSCATFYVYLARVDADHLRVTYGFDNAKYRMVWVHVEFVGNNEDTGYQFFDSATTTLALRDNWERSFTKFSGSGTVVGHAIITAHDALGHTCSAQAPFYGVIYVY